jgi:glycosyltransferase involved in cell wall biosynthesis
MRQGVIDASVPPDKVSVIPNASDLELFRPDIDGSAYRRIWNAEGKFVCLYFGAMGEMNDLIQILQAALVLKQRDVNDVLFVIYGKGRQREMLLAYQQEHRLDNVRILDPLPKREMPQVVAAADVGMTIYMNLPVFFTNSPNKLFDTFAAGKPAIVNTPAWLKQMVEEHRCGVFTPQNDPEAFADTILWLRDHPEAVAEYGRNARRLAEAQFNRQVHADQILAILARVVSSTSAGLSWKTH